MPIYDFQCNQCEKVFELIVLGSAADVCPHCGSDNLQVQVSAPARPSKMRDLIAGARRQAAREGHFSHYASGEQPRRK